MNDRKADQDKLDESLEESFPASDPPSHSGVTPRRTRIRTSIPSSPTDVNWVIPPIAAREPAHTPRA